LSVSPSLIILYEHAPLVARLADRLRRLGVTLRSVCIHDASIATDQQDDGTPVVNRVGAYPASGGDVRIVLKTRSYLADLEASDRRVFNGAHSYLVATSKLRQRDVIAGAGCRAPRSEAVRHVGDLATAARGLRYPLILKPNVGGSGVGIHVLHDAAGLTALAADPDLLISVDGVGVLQEYHPPRDGMLARLEFLGEELLYASRQPVLAGTFNYCARGGCHAGDGTIEIIDPPSEAVEEARAIVRAAQADFGAVEYVVSDRDGERYWFDINPFSNYVADVERLGFDPDDRLARFLAAAVSSAGK